MFFAASAPAGVWLDQQKAKPQLLVGNGRFLVELSGFYPILEEIQRHVFFKAPSSDFEALEKSLEITGGSFSPYTTGGSN